MVIGHFLSSFPPSTGGAGETMSGAIDGRRIINFGFQHEIKISRERETLFFHSPSVDRVNSISQIQISRLDVTRCGAAVATVAVKQVSLSASGDNRCARERLPGC